MTPMTVTDPPKPQNVNLPALTTASFDVKTVARCTAKYKRGTRESTVGILLTAVANCGPQLPPLMLSLCTNSMNCDVLRID